MGIAAACLLASPFASAQRVGARVPFIGGSTGFDPEISVVNSGAVLDAQPVVSSDLKYVTINTRASVSNLVALRDFTFQTGGNARLGFVGGAGSNAGRPGALDRPGMTFLSGLD
jgi:hypothetical protein